LSLLVLRKTRQLCVFGFQGTFVGNILSLHNF
jgi:hypothetical protein